MREKPVMKPRNKKRTPESLQRGTAFFVRRQIERNGGHRFAMVRLWPKFYFNLCLRHRSVKRMHVADYEWRA